MNAHGITIKEIANLLEISSTTVSRVLAGHARKYRISQKTEELVRETANKYNFQPNQVAQQLRLKRTNTIGLIIPDISNPFFANLARMAEQELRNKGKMILLCNTNDSTELEKETLSLITGRQVDGLLIAPVGQQGEHFKMMKGTPIVFIDRYFRELSIPYVSTHNENGAYQASKYLIKKGHTHIACIQGLMHTISNQDRVNGFLRATAEFHLPEEQVNLLGDNFSIENGYKSAKILLEQEDPPTAIFALNNQIAIGVLLAAKDLGKVIPDDFSLISFDEQPYFQLTSPPITTISQPIAQIGIEAVKMLFKLIDNEKVENQLISPELIERQSVKAI